MNPCIPLHLALAVINSCQSCFIFNPLTVFSHGIILNQTPDILSSIHKYIFFNGSIIDSQCYVSYTGQSSEAETGQKCFTQDVG